MRVTYRLFCMVLISVFLKAFRLFRNSSRPVSAHTWPIKQNVADTAQA